MQDISALLTAPAGAFFHQLTITLILFGAIIVAIGRNSPVSTFPANRMLLGLLILLGFRLALSGAALVQLATGAAATVQPVLERGLSTASAAILVWLWAFPERRRAADAATLILSVFILALTVTGIGTSQQVVPVAAGAVLTGAVLWQAFTIGLCVVGVILLLRLRPPVWGYGVSLLTVIAAGEIAGLLIAEPAASTGILRLTQVAALPILLTLPQRIVPAVPAPAAAPPVVRPAPERKRVNLPPAIFDNFLNLALEKDLLVLCRHTAEIVSFALVADICLVLSRPTSTDEIIIFCGYDQVLEQEIGGAQIAARHLPMIASAIQKHAPLRLPASSASSDLKFLSSSLRLPKSGHLLVAPIRTRQPSDLGALVLLTPYSSRTWTQDDQNYLARAAEGLSGLLDRARTHAEHEDALRGVERELEETRDRERQHAAELQLLRREGASGNDHQAAAAAAVNLVAELEAEAQARRLLEEELEMLRTEHARLNAEIAGQTWDQTVQHLQAENIQLQLAVDELESDLKYLHTRAESLKIAREETLAVLEKLTSENRTLVEERDAQARKPAHSSENGNPTITERGRDTEDLQTALREIDTMRSTIDAAELRMVELENLAAAGENLTHQWESIISLAEEMRQPMSSILGYSDFLLTESVGLLGALQRKFLERVKSSTNRMSTMVEDLIHLAAAESGKLKLTLGKVDLNNLIDSAVAAASAQIREKRIALLVNLPEDIPLIEGDREAIRHTLSHLLRNAVSATPEQGEISIEIILEEDEGSGRYIHLSVRDSGTGIPAEYIETGFDRKIKSRDRQIPGLGVTGSGLSIARTLVEAHGGRIWVETGSGSGTTFAVLLPVSRDVAETLTGNRGG